MLLLFQPYLESPASASSYGADSIVSYDIISLECHYVYCLLPWFSFVFGLIPDMQNLCNFSLILILFCFIDVVKVTKVCILMVSVL